MNEKILVITSNYPRFQNDTCGWFIHELNKNLSMCGLSIIVLSPHSKDSKKYEIMDGIRIYRFPYFYPYSLQKLAYDSGIPINIKRSFLAKVQLIPFLLSELIFATYIIHKEKIALIHTHWLYPQGLIGAFLKRVYNIKHITTVHGTDIHFAKKNFLLKNANRFICDNTNIITTNSSYTKNSILCINNKIVNKISLVPMGIHMRALNTPDIGLKQTLGVDNLLLSVSRLIELKGINYLVSSIAIVIKKFPSTMLLIIGDGPEKENLIKLTHDLHLDNHVKFLGFIENRELTVYYHASDIFIQPSITINDQSEAFGVTILEAMIYDVPVIATNSGGIGDIIINGQNGILVKERSPEELADKIIGLLSNKRLSGELTAHAKNTIFTKFSWDVITKKFINIYNSD